jgi:hypothetical protein
MPVPSQLSYWTGLKMNALLFFSLLNDLVYALRYGKFDISGSKQELIADQFACPNK